MKSKQRIRLLLAYSGGGFEGWQIQKKGRTVQGVLQDALLKMSGVPVKITGSGRTDSGVHASGQVAHFDTELRIDPKRFTPALNRLLPPDVRILESGGADETFHSRFDAKRRIYQYRLTNQFSMLPQQKGDCLYTRDKLDLNRLNHLCSVLVGTHDFTTFTAAGDPSPNRIRTLYTSFFYEKNGTIIYRIEGNAFLWKMVRSIVGTLLQCGAAGMSKSEFRRLLLSKERKNAGTTAPAYGLTLEKVLYEQ